jgi:TRAP-type C4-dicarboxylate transport system substrate-binding protein
MKKANVTLSIAFLVIMVFIFTPVAQAQTQQKPFELSFGHIWPNTSAQGQLYAEWAHRVEKGTNGRVKITVHSSSTLCPAPETWNCLKSGAMDIGSTFANYHRSGFEFNNVHLFFWLGGPSDIEVSLKHMDRFREQFPILMKEFSDAKILWMGAQGPRMLFTTKPIRTVDDMKGKLLRAATPAEVKLLQAFGAVTPGFMHMGEVYTSLQKGIIQGLWVCQETLQSFRLGEVAKYVTDMNFGVGQNKYMAMRWDVWNKLPRDIQQVFERESAWAKVEDIKVWTKGDEDGIKFAKSKGVQFINITPQEYQKMMSTIAPIQDEEAKKLDAKGYPGTALLREMRKAFAKDK